MRAGEWLAQLRRRGAARTASRRCASIIWAQTTPNHAALKSTPLSVAQRLAEQRQLLGGSWIFVSATLAVGDSLQHFARAVGMPEADQAILPSPFDYQRQAGLWVADQVGPVAAPDFPNRVAAAHLAADPGKQGPGLRALHDPARGAHHCRRAAGAGGTRLLVLTQGDAPRHELLQRFRNARAAVLVGAAGFWEGVDVVGDQLSLVVIDKLPVRTARRPGPARAQPGDRSSRRQFLRRAVAAGGGDVPEAGRQAADPLRARSRAAGDLRRTPEQPQLRQAAAGEHPAVQAGRTRCRRRWAACPPDRGTRRRIGSVAGGLGRRLPAAAARRSSRQEAALREGALQHAQRVVAQFREAELVVGDDHQVQGLLHRRRLLVQRTTSCARLAAAT